MRRIELFFLVLGLLLLGVLLERVGWSALWEQLRAVGWWFALVLALSVGRYLARTLAWRYAFPANLSLPAFGEMFQAVVAGQSLGYLTIAGPLLSEPAKAAVLRQQLPMRVGLRGAVLEAAVFALTSTVVMVAGLIPALLRITADDGIRRLGWLVAGLLAALALAGHWILRRRVPVVARMLAGLSRTPLRRWTDPWRELLVEAEAGVHEFFVRERPRFRRVAAWDVAAQLFALLEIYVILAALGVEAGWVDVLILEAWGKLLRTVFFFVPARVGTDEGGQALVFELLGFGLARGVGLALVQRLRAILWAGVGLAALSRYALRRQR